MWEYNQTNTLAHTGVKGMKWGHRRTQVSATRKTLQDSKKDYYKFLDEKYSKDPNKTWSEGNQKLDKIWVNMNNHELAKLSASGEKFVKKSDMYEKAIDKTYDSFNKFGDNARKYLKEKYGVDLIY